MQCCKKLLLQGYDAPKHYRCWHRDWSWNFWQATWQSPCTKSTPFIPNPIFQYTRPWFSLFIILKAHLNKEWKMKGDAAVQFQIVRKTIKTETSLIQRHVQKNRGSSEPRHFEKLLGRINLEFRWPGALALAAVSAWACRISTSPCFLLRCLLSNLNKTAFPLKAKIWQAFLFSHTFCPIYTRQATHAPLPLPIALQLQLQIRPKTYWTRWFFNMKHTFSPFHLAVNIQQGQPR